MWPATSWKDCWRRADPRTMRVVAIQVSQVLSGFHPWPPQFPYGCGSGAPGDSVTEFRSRRRLLRHRVARQPGANGRQCLGADAGYTVDVFDRGKGPLRSRSATIPRAVSSPMPSNCIHSTHVARLTSTRKSNCRVGSRSTSTSDWPKPLSRIQCTVLSRRITPPATHRKRRSPAVRPRTLTTGVGGVTAAPAGGLGAMAARRMSLAESVSGTATTCVQEAEGVAAESSIVIRCGSPRSSSAS